MPSVILDANLLVLLTVGMTNRSFIGKHKRTKTYTEEDYALLCLILEQYRTIITTPSLLTEAYNLVAQIGEPDRTAIMETLRVLIKSQEEHYKPSATVSENPYFIRLGLTDSGILEIAGKDRPLITTDLDLYLAAVGNGDGAINFNHLRMEYFLNG